MQTQSLTFSRLLRMAGSLFLLLSFWTLGQTADQHFETVFQKAVKAYGAEYLELEQQLLTNNSTSTFESHLKDADPMARFVATALLSAKQQPEHQEVMKYLDRQPQVYKDTILVQPPPSAIGSGLYRNHGAKLADFIALRLTKEEAPPNWRVGTFLWYLEQSRQPSTTIAIIKYAQTANVNQLERVKRTLKAIGDPDLLSKLEAERKAVEANGGNWPAVLDALVPKGEKTAPEPKIGFPHPPPIADADLSVRHPEAVEIPVAMEVVRKGDSLTVRFSKFQTTNLLVGFKMVIGFNDEEFITVGGEARLRGMSLGAFQPTTNVVILGRQGLPPPGQEFVLEHRITLFETDVPIQHMWTPQSGKHYKVLWARTFRETIK